MVRTQEGRGWGRSFVGASCNLLHKVSSHLICPTDNIPACMKVDGRQVSLTTGTPVTFRVDIGTSDTQRPSLRLQYARVECHAWYHETCTVHLKICAYCNHWWSCRRIDISQSSSTFPTITLRISTDTYTITQSKFQTMELQT